MIPSIQLPEQHKLLLNEVMAMGGKEHGEAPGLKSAAAAHGAGHILIATIAGSSVTEARLIQDRMSGVIKWESLVELNEALVQGFVTDKTDLFVLLKAALYFMAGFAGECWAELDHPCSATPDRFISNFCCTHLDHAIGLPDHTFRHRVISQIDQTLSLYSGEFHALRYLLEDEGSISENEIIDTLGCVEPANLQELFGGMQ